NNTVIHSKGYSIVSALDAVLGRKTFERVYKKILMEYGGRRLGWKDLQQVFEADSGRDLSWFFDQWVRSNAYLCYQVESRESKQIEGGYISSVKVKQLGTMSMPVPVKAIFEDGSSMVAFTRRDLETTKLTFNSRSRLKEVILNPDHKLAMLEKPVPELSKEAAKALAWGWSFSDIGRLYEVLKDENIPSSDIWYRSGMYLYDSGELNKALNCFRKVDSLHEEGTTKFAAHGWMGLIHDLKGSREEALKYYKSGLKYDTGKPMKHSRLRINMDRGWFEERLKIPFTYGTKIEIPDNPTSDELQSILSDLAWQREEKTPLLIYEKAKGVKIDRIRFWFKLGMLLYDSKYYTESFDTFSRVLDLEPSELYTFTVYTWLGHVRDLLGEREEALQLYRKALEHDTGDAMTHSQYRMRINRQWVEKRLKAPFTR
ncbi:MAG: hypothetical protein KAX11_08240, partial [Candidatus Aminicenantes bacterium]|nr:hypothetical protein [Candidatus Aminicenantes bacterium]